MNRLKIGLAGLFHRNARGDDEAYERIISELAALAEKEDFELCVAPDKIYGYDDGRRMVDALNAIDLDFTFMFSASVTIGNAVIPFGHLRSPIGIWSIPEGGKTGLLPLNSFCGSMIFAGTLGKYLVDYNIKFKWFYGYTDNPLFRDRFGVTLRALRAIHRLKSTRLACIGPVVDGFDYMVVDESRLESLYGVRVERLHSMEEIVARAEALSGAAVKEELVDIDKEGVRTGNVADSSMSRFARLSRAFREFAREHNYDALSISCWRRLQEAYGMVACGSISRLNNAGIIAACEGDVDGAIGMIIDTAFNGGAPASMVDLVSIDEADSSLNIWHCGPSPSCMADNVGVRWDHHFNMGRWEGGEWHGCGVVADLSFKPGVVTVHRICSRTKELVAFVGEVFEKETYQGSSGWVRNFRMRGNRLSIPELLSAIYHYRVDHHMTFGYGDNEEAYREFAKWKGIAIGESSEYVNYLE